MSTVICWPHLGCFTLKIVSLLGPDAAAAVEDNRGDADMAPENETSPNQRDAMDKTKGEQANVKIELENVNLGGEGWEGDEKKDTGAVVVVDRQPLTSPESQKRKRKTTVAKVLSLILFVETSICT
jgi:hypothetical protein